MSTLMLGIAIFDGMMSEISGISLSSDNITQKLKKDHGNAESNGTEILQCPPYFDSILCWSRTNASKTATLPCPPASIMASIMGHTDLASDNLRVLAMASKVCLANGTWYRDSHNVSWSNYSLCILNSTRYMIDDVEKLNYPRWYEIPPAESSLLNVSCIYLFYVLNIN